MQNLELWGGHECTINRVGDRYADQTERSGHYDRIDDLDRFASLGLKRLRYPALWERIAPDAPDEQDWSWLDERVARMRGLGLPPILGLVHHGSGPRYAPLLDASFAEGLARHGHAAAQRYPWVKDWTPVNEPLTTARFCALYGHWHPHASNEPAFWTALLNQIDGVRLAMRAIRRVIPDARLIQTEDLGRTFATPPAAAQAEHDNARRWMTWDLLFGRVDRDHPLWGRLCRLHLQARLETILADPCPPDIVGVNHYLTSDRFLDHRGEQYPPTARGGNGYVDFADVEAIRVLTPRPPGLEGALQECWTRYGRPLSVTEAHNGCTREEQMRWLIEAWSVAGRLRARGVEIASVTAWSLLGAYDWSSLLTRADGLYEPGPFDVSGVDIRETALAGAMRALARGAPCPSPAASGPGWWRRDVRLCYTPVRMEQCGADPTPDRPDPDLTAARPLLIVGATGTLGRALAHACALRGLPYVLTSRRELDLASAASCRAALDRDRPWAVLNAAGWVRVDDAEANEVACRAANTEGAARLAACCANQKIAFASFSSDLVFDGEKTSPYVEQDAPRALNAYGRSKHAAEDAVLQAHDAALVVRTAAFFSPHDPHNFASQVTRDLRAWRKIEAADDILISPTFVPDLANAVLDLLIDEERGIWHLANVGALTWAEFATTLAEACGLDGALVKPTPAHRFNWPAPRPARSALASTRGAVMPTLESAIARYAAALREMTLPVGPPLRAGLLEPHPAAATAAEARAKVSSGDCPGR